VKEKGKYSPALIVALLLILSAAICKAQSIAVTPYDLLPEQQVVIEGQSVPQWKAVWDEARGLAVAGNFVDALDQYKTLLILKNNLEEARWELVRLHMYLKQWDAASAQLERLIEDDPDRSIYLVAQGRVLWETGQYERAVDLFRTAYQQNPEDQIALAGLAEGLNKLGKKEEALPLLERLSLQEPANFGVRRYLAMLFYDSENYKKAKPHLVVLSGQDSVEQEILYKTAVVHEKLGLSHIAVKYWQRVLQREPDHMEAHSYLAGYYDEVGQPEQALLHLQAIQATTPDNKVVFAGIGRAYEKQGEFDKALTFYDRYLDQYPDDREILRRVVKIHAAKGRKKQTLATLDQYFTQDKEKESKELKQQARRYDEAGRYHDAIILYRQLVELSPDDPEILASLANDLLAIGANEGALSMWRHLTEIAPHDLSIYRSMADLLKRLERYDDLLEVLHKIHTLNPADNWAILQLAILYLEKGEFAESEKYFNKLPAAGCLDPECLQNRAVLYEKLNLPEHALIDYEALLKLLPDRYQVRLKIIELAGGLGLIDQVLANRQFLEAKPSVSSSNEFKLSLADAYRVSGYLAEAISEYRGIINKSLNKTEKEAISLRQRSWLGISAAYQSDGLYYESEQVLRLALASDENPEVFLQALLDLSVSSGQANKSRIWYGALQEVLQNSDENIKKSVIDWQMELWKARIFAVSGNYESAVNICMRLIPFFPLAKSNTETPKKYVSQNNPVIRIRLDLARYLIALGELVEAENLSTELWGIRGDDLEVLLLLEQIYNLSGETVRAQEYGVRVLAVAEKDMGSLLTLIALYKSNGNIPRQLAATAKAVSKAPDSLAAKLLLIQAHINSGNLSAALDLTEQISSSNPGNTWVRTNQIKLLARIGRFADALNLGNVFLEGQPERVDILLLKARILWQQNFWGDSVAIYKSYLRPPVEELLEQQVNQLGLVVDVTPESTIWNKLTFSEGASLSITEVMMSPHHAVDLSEKSQKVNNVAASHYALYRWQERLDHELSVRKLVQRRYYHYAITQMENLIKDFGSDEFLLFDLAGLNSKLERLQEEAFLYAELKQQNKDFPGLQDAVQRNRLKRRPRVSLAYVMQEDDGYDGYKAIRKKAADLTGWYSDSSSNDWSLNLQRIKYNSTNNDQDIKSWRAMLNIESKLSQAFQLKFGTGFENLEDGYDTTPLFYAAIIGKLRDEMRATLSFRQDVTADTIDSLTRDIILREYKIDFLFDLLPRVLMGGDYQYSDYSDSNWTNKYTFWSSYLFIPEPTLLKFSYKFDYYDSGEGQLSPLPPDKFGFAPNDHPYWAPIDYWITRFSLFFKHQISNDTLARGVPSYYTLEYSLGYDSDDNDLHEIKGSVSLELYKHFTINASYGYSDLDVYNHEEAHLSAIYSW
jgi:tetratricopeptide (TPR) repeat protein